MRLIDADACIDYIRNNNQHAWEALAYAPTIDAVEVVRCKDCKNWHEWENGAGSCNRSGNDWNWFGVDATDYCSFGEKR